MIPTAPRDRDRHEDISMIDAATERSTEGPANGAEIDVEVGADRTVRVHLAGRWHLGDGLPSTRLVEQALRASHPPCAVSFEAARLVSWDSSMLLVLRRIDRLCRGLGVPVTVERLPVDARRLLALADAVPEQPGGRTAATRPPWLVRVGETVAAGWDSTRESIGFLGETTLAFARLLTRRAVFRARDLAVVVQETAGRRRSAS